MSRRTKKHHDAYIEEYFKAIKNSKTKTEIITTLNSIYEDGFSDGYHEGQLTED